MAKKALNQYIVEWAQSGEQDLHEDFARYVRVMRKRRNYSRREFADVLAISVDYLVAIENGLVLPIEYEQRCIERYLNLSYSEFRERVSAIRFPATVPNADS